MTGTSSNLILYCINMARRAAWVIGPFVFMYVFAGGFPHDPMALSIREVSWAAGGEIGRAYLFLELMVGVCIAVVKVFGRVHQNAKGVAR